MRDSLVERGDTSIENGEVEQVEEWSRHIEGAVDNNALERTVEHMDGWRSKWTGEGDLKKRH